MSLMGLDIGTTGTKAVVFSIDGQILASAYRTYDELFPSLVGWRWTRTRCGKLFVR